MSEEWGPWIEHDGKGCPCVGSYVHVKIRGEGDLFAVAGQGCKTNGVDPNGPLSAWVWAFEQDGDVISYRIRKPRALLQLIEMVENLPAHQMEDA